MSTAEILRAAGKIIEQGGFCKGILADEHGAHCAVGAINQASGWHLDMATSLDAWQEHEVVLRALSEVVAEQYPGRLCSDGHLCAFCVIDVNNHPDTTKEEMVALFEKAAIRAEETAGLGEDEVLS